MSLFRKAGEKFEETKRSVMSGKRSEYVCRSCEEPVDKAYKHCPHCGDGPIEPVE